MKSKNETQWMQIANLHEHPDNPRSITEDKLNTLAKSLKEDKELFFARPIIASSRTGKNVILAGHQRFKASQINGDTEVPVIVLPGLTEDDEKRIMLKDNADNYGQFDWDIMDNNGWIDDILNNETLGISLPEQFIPQIESDAPEAKERPITLQDFSIYFANDDEYAEFMKFLTHLRNRFSGYPSVSKRILAWVAELYEENNQLEDSELIMRLIRISNNEAESTENATEDYGDLKGQL